MINEKFLKNTDNLINTLKKLEVAPDLDEGTLENLDIDFGEIFSWSRHIIEKLLQEVLYKNNYKSRINELKDQLISLKDVTPENANLFDEIVKAIEAMQWTQNNLVKVHKKEKQELWKKAVNSVYKDAVAKHDLVMGETKYIDLHLLKEICDKQLGGNKQ